MTVQNQKLTQKFDVRAHVPSNDVSGAEYKPVYEETKARMDQTFGKRSLRHWPATPGTCSKCFSVTPAIVEL